jgi:hypothetical protein
VRWDDLRESSNVEDVRGSTGGGGRGLKLGIGGTLIALVVSYFLGVDPRVILGLVSSVPNQQSAPTAAEGTPSDEQGRFIAAVLGGTEDTWSEIFRQNGATYVPPTLVLYRDQMPTACGSGSAAAGPFYCPLDRKVYLDLSFFQQLAQEFQAPGQFAEAYVVAHEVGHHVQNLLGIAVKVRAVQQRSSEAEANQLSVRLELQADCFAGVWGNRSQAQLNWLQAGDVDAALNAASSVGDDTLQKQARGYAVPDSFTHGTSAQRSRWFKTGFASGDIKSCDTFSASSL